MAGLGEVRSDASVVRNVTKLLEGTGLLNRGSSTSSANKDLGSDTQTVGISTNTLNVTRVGGLASLVTGVGAAAVALFKLTGSTPHVVKAVAFASVGVIVAAALLTAGMIIQADVKSRTALELDATRRSSQRRAAAPDGSALWAAAISKLSDAALAVLFATSREDALLALGRAQAIADGSGHFEASGVAAGVAAGLMENEQAVVNDLVAVLDGADPVARGPAITARLAAMRRLVAAG